MCCKPGLGCTQLFVHGQHQSNAGSVPDVPHSCCSCRELDCLSNGWRLMGITVRRHRPHHTHEHRTQPCHSRLLTCGRSLSHLETTSSLQHQGSLGLALMLDVQLQQSCISPVYGLTAHLLLTRPMTSSMEARTPIGFPVHPNWFQGPPAEFAHQYISSFGVQLLVILGEKDQSYFKSR